MLNVTGTLCLAGTVKYWLGITFLNQPSTGWLLVASINCNCYLTGNFFIGKVGNFGAKVHAIAFA